MRHPATVPRVCLPVRHRGAPAAPSHAKKRASSSQHRASAQRTAWEDEFDKLEALFGDGLAGLSGLELADTGDE